VTAHPESDKLFVERIDIGDAGGPRTIISGLRGFVTEKEFRGKNVVVVANLEPRKMRGIVSEGMVLCASDDGKQNVLLLDVSPSSTHSLTHSLTHSPHTGAGRRPTR